MLLPLCDGFCVWSLFCGVLFAFLSIFFNCVVAICALCLFLTMPKVGLHSEIVAFPGHTHFLNVQAV